MKKVTEIPCAAPLLVLRKKVAAYARISIESERMQHSLSTQISYYNQLIQGNPEWEFAGVYSDDGISGTSIRKREGFRRMLADCEAGKIDIILTKSIQRFARNTVDLLQTVRHLKEMGVEVRFEKEHIHSLSGDGELMLTILASFAQEESRSISENVRWRVRKCYEQGLPTNHFRIFGYRWEGERLVIEPEEATIVRRIFQNFIDGKSRLETEREFAAEGIKTMKGCKWRDSNIKQVLTNVTYTGNLLFQKEYVTDPIDGRRKKNCGELPMYYAENTHEPIIDKGTFDFVQQEMARRKALGPLANKSLHTTCFTGKIKCGICGKSFVHFRYKTMDAWGCAYQKIKRKRCSMRGAIPQRVLKAECASVLGLDVFDEGVFLEKVEKIVVPEHHVMEFHLTDGQVVTRHWVSTAKKDCWTDEFKEQQKAWMRRYMREGKGTRFSAFTARIRCGKCGASYQKRDKYWRCSKRDECQSLRLNEEALKRLSASILEIPEFDEAVLRAHVDIIDVEEHGRLVFHFFDGTEKEAIYVQEKRQHARKEKKHGSQSDTSDHQ